MRDLLVDANVDTRHFSSAEERRIPLDHVLCYHDWFQAHDWPEPATNTATPNPLPLTNVHLFSGSYRTHTRLYDIATTAWTTADEWTSIKVTTLYVAFSTKATSDSSTTVSSIRQVLQRRQRDEQLQRLSPEQRQLYDDIQALRDQVAPGQFDVVQAIRELREGG